MSSLFALTLVMTHSSWTTYAAVMPHAARRDSTAVQSVQSHGMSTEALLTLVGVCVAVFGTALTLVLSWPSLEVRWGLCTSRRPHSRQRSRSLSTTGSAIALVDVHETLATPAHPAEPWTHSSNGDEIPRPQRVQSCYTEHQHALMRRAHTS
ncbi:hypothetical protein GT037_005546 [Alternaria burnsii]|uniref:Membrane-associated protein n=1 Tax=Alternaria burnsii TaxID=1187904 RepID=A0A8H7EHK0_9PLEO|nr:uncharacterized protein GT037_005546 [Alternaria burnsii]KAF7676041.1 hypothetical protein GT037_005546 [Alternaria burnsii]